MGRVVVSMGEAVERRNGYIRDHVAGLGLTHESTVIDMGAGQLSKSHLIGRARYFATDIRQLDGLDFVSDAERLPLQDKSVDLVLGLELLEHVANPANILEETSRVLRPGATAIFSTPATFPRHDENDYWRFTAQGLRVMASHHFESSIVIPFGHTFETLAVLVGYYVQLAARRHFSPLERLVPRLERVGERLDGRIAWARSNEGLHTLNCDLLLIARRASD